MGTVHCMWCLVFNHSHNDSRDGNIRLCFLRRTTSVVQVLPLVLKNWSYLPLMVNKIIVSDLYQDTLLP